MVTSDRGGSVEYWDGQLVVWLLLLGNVGLAKY